MSEGKPKKKSMWWSSFSRYQNCPQQFLWHYGQPGHDLGAGDGEPKPRPKPSSDHHRIMGIVIQYAIELLYNDQIYKLPPDELGVKLDGIIVEKFKEELSAEGVYLDPKWAPSRAEMLRICRQGVFNYLTTMVENKFLAEVSEAEKFMMVNLGDGDLRVGARPDMFLVNPRRDDVYLPGVTILDGKNSTKKHTESGSHIDPDQLRWYAMVYYLFSGEMPDRLGFVYYRYPHGTVIPDSDERDPGVSWIDFNRSDLERLAVSAVEVDASIAAGDFGAQVKPAVCKYCDWEDVCPERQAQLEEYRRKHEKVMQFSVEPDQFGFRTVTVADTEMVKKYEQ